MKLPHRPLTNLDLSQIVKKLKIPYFRGVFVRDKLPTKINIRETGIVNLDSHIGKGTHWVAYSKNGDLITYFDSYGNLRPPRELVKYFYSDGSTNHIQYNYNRYQKNSYNCGHLCLSFLYNQHQKRKQTVIKK